ncbi:hypothetical protein GCM10009587_32600 [Microbacterium maritypicum]
MRSADPRSGPHSESSPPVPVADPANVEEQPLSGQVEHSAPTGTELFLARMRPCRYMTEEYEDNT